MKTRISKRLRQWVEMHFAYYAQEPNEHGYRWYLRRYWNDRERCDECGFQLKANLRGCGISTIMDRHREYAHSPNPLGRKDVP